MCVSVGGCDVVGSVEEVLPVGEPEELDPVPEEEEVKERGVSGVMSPYAITRARS